jgi:acyl-homoserine-lactone acylase
VTTAAPEAADALQSVPLRPLASNGWAFGRDVVEGGKAVLFGNPHFPWAGTDRLYEARLTVPGQFDVSGVTLPGVPVIGLGYNAHVAWTHTVSTARRFTIAELTLAAGDPLSYVVDGVAKPLVAVTIDVPLAPDANGAPRSSRRTYYRSEFGPLVVNPQLGLAWTAQRAYAFADVNLDNGRAIDTWLAMASVTSVQKLRTLLERDRSIPYFNTIAADDSGEVLYADIGAIPKVERADIERCLPSAGAAALLNAASIVVLNGSDASCRWQAASGAPAGDSLLPAARMPAVIRTDVVLNSNDSYWLTNPLYTFPADLSPILGPVGKPQGLRTRAALDLIGTHLGGQNGSSPNKIDANTVAALWARNDNHAAALVLRDVIDAACLAGVIPASRTAACEALMAWDRTSSLDARGAPLFREVWDRVRKLTPALWAVPFDPASPVSTPRGLKQDDASRAAIAQRVDDAVAAMQAQGIAVAASLRDVQGIDAGGRFVPVPGSDEFEGVLNKVTSTLANGRYTPQYGTSYVQLVTLGGSTAAPNARGFLSYSQSTDPRSAHFNDQIEFFSTMSLQPLPDLRLRP